MAYEQALQALADPTRRVIFERLRHGPLPVGRIALGLPVSRPAVSQHLRVLEEAGLVKNHAEGTRRFYRVETKGLEDLRRYLERFWGDVLDAFRSEAERGAPASRRRRKTNPSNPNKPNPNQRNPKETS